jgi:hypothetical protein
MAFVTYVARRGLAPLHSASTTYTMSLPALERFDPRRETRIEQQRSLSGAQESRYYHGKMLWSVQLEPLYAEDAALVLEFLKSTEDGQIFTFDPVGSPDSPSPQSLSVVRSDQGHTEQRLIQRGRGGADDVFSYGFEIREA